MENNDEQIDFQKTLKEFLKSSFIVYDPHIIYTGIPKDIHDDVLRMFKSILGTNQKTEE